MNLQDTYEAGERAREVLENEQFKAAFEAIEKELIDQWTQSPARDADGREKLWLMLQMLRKVHSCLAKTMDSGKLAMAEIKHKKTIRDRLQSALSR